MSRISGRSSQVSRQLLPFVGASVLAWVAVPIGSPMDWGLYAFAAAIGVLAGIWCILPLGTALERTRVLSASLLFLVAIALLRNSAGGLASGASVLSLLPVFYVALHGDRRQLYIVVAGVAVLFLAPILLQGPPDYPHTGYRAGVLFIAVSAIIGLSTQWLVAQARDQTADAQYRERMMEEVAGVVRGLSGSRHAREEVCNAAMTISNASLAILYEPVEASALLRSSSMAGIEGDPIELPMDARSGTCEVYRTGRPLFLTKDSQSEFFNSEIWERAGRPTSILFEPLLRGAEPVGVLVVGWPDTVRPQGTRATAIALLAHEIVTVVERADMLSQMTDMARTDPLTGLPNRRAWETSLRLALAKDQRVALAMLDLDHFKEFNDTHGHPAGDRLLRETAAAWREELRAGDVVARLGGDEFGLLLPDCDRVNALEVVERLRRRIPNEQTCSAGIATREPGMAPEALLARADDALYEAKLAGRDRTQVES